MKHLTVQLFTVVLAVAVLTVPAHGQLSGLPDYFSPKGTTGLTLSGDYGRCTSECGGGLNPSFIGARATLGLPIVTIGVGGGSYNTDVSGADKEITFASNVAVRLIGGALLPVSVNVQAGVGFLKVGDLTTDFIELTTTTVPIGVGIAANVPTPGASIEPWIAPRIQVTRTKLELFLGGPLSGTSTDTHFGISGGVNIGLAGGLGFHAAFDYLNLNGVSPITIGVGLHYTFKLPGIGVPMVPGV